MKVLRWLVVAVFALSFCLMGMPALAVQDSPDFEISFDEEIIFYDTVNLFSDINVPVTYISCNDNYGEYITIVWYMRQNEEAEWILLGNENVGTTVSSSDVYSYVYVDKLRPELDGMQFMATVTLSVPDYTPVIKDTGICTLHLFQPEAGSITQLDGSASGQITLEDPLFRDERHYDTYALTLAEGDYAQITMEAAENSNLDCYLYVFTPSNVMIAYNDDFNNLNSALGFLAPEAGEYIIMAANYGYDLEHLPADYTITEQHGSQLVMESTPDLSAPVEITINEMNDQSSHLYPFTVTELTKFYVETNYQSTGDPIYNAYMRPQLHNAAWGNSMMQNYDSELDEFYYVLTPGYYVLSIDYFYANEMPQGAAFTLTLDLNALSAQNLVTQADFPFEQTYNLADADELNIFHFDATGENAVEATLTFSGDDEFLQDVSGAFYYLWLDNDFALLDKGLCVINALNESVSISRFTNEEGYLVLFPLFGGGKGSPNLRGYYIPDFSWTVTLAPLNPVTVAGNQNEQGQVVGGNFSFDITDYTGNTAAPEAGGIRYLPISWAVGSHEENFGETMSGSLDVSALTEGTLAITLQKQTYLLGTWYNDGAPVTINTIDFTVAFTLAFVANGGTETNPVIVDNGTEIQAPADPVREGFQFTGWFMDEALTTPAAFPLTITENVTLYAGWEAVHVGDISYLWAVLGALAAGGALLTLLLLRKKAAKS